ncbi:MAG: thioredoxin domain-containing protein [Deltaproteobacteria bacterium]|nr:thioredoxin domain-containing protein [Deltaproteobacteria bacterium]
MKDFFEQTGWTLLIIIVASASFSYLNCQGAAEKGAISANDLGKIGRLQVDDLTPAEVKRLDIVINSEASPCGNNITIAKSILNPNLCPLTVHAVNYILTLIKQDYNDEEISKMYISRYASVKGLEIPVNGSPRWGADNPEITVVVFSDFECPFCANAAKVVDKIANSYPDKISVMHKDFPLVDIHPIAMLGARAGYAANKQGKFKEMHDVLYSLGQAQYNPDKLRTIAIGLGLNIDEFEDDLASDQALAAINADIELANKLGAKGTPSIFVNGRIVENGINGLEERIKEEFIRINFSKK